MTHSCVSEQQYCRGALGAALALLLCVGLSARAAAQPPGAAIGVGPISALAVDPHTPTTLYASTECSGVLKSLDGGDTWTAKTSGLGEPVPGVGALAIDPVTPTTVYAGTTAGVFKSTDGGDTWSVANSGLGEPAPGVGALAIDPVTPTTVYAGTEAGVFKSTDGGNTWGAPSLTRISVVELDIDPTVPTTLYAVATQDQRRGVHKSTDGGSSWVLVYTSREISSVAVDPSTPGTLYLGGSHFSEAGRSVAVVKSTDGAETWFPVITTGSPIRVYALVIDPTSLDKLYAGTHYRGVSKSTDGGETWERTGLDQPAHGLVIAPSAPDTLYAVSGDAVLRTTDGSATWQATGLGDGLVCGDGILVAGLRYWCTEQCDDGNLVDGDGCDSNCTPTGCGNSVRTAGEQCDHGGESATCNEDCTTASCGDGKTNGTAHEDCDDGNAVDGDGCDSNCTPTGCGNDVLTAGEECDDGNGRPWDGCTADCTICGNGQVTAPEECDDGNLDSEDACRDDCRFNVCGDGRHNPAVEVCDDGNLTDGDGCDSNCTPTGCGNGAVSPGEECDDGNALDGDGCDSNCTPTACGNGIRSAAEQCDDGNLNPFDSCTANCTICGDGEVTAPEECDDGNSDSSDGCTTACTICGNGVLTAPEGCDDGNLVSGDGCEDYCAAPGCGNAVVEGDEECDDGGICAGGPDAGAACTLPGQCTGAECRPAGGDGCAANCTTETSYQMFFDRESSETTITLARWPHQEGNDVLSIPVSASGSLVLDLGSARPGSGSDEIPVAVRAAGVNFMPISFWSGCVCIRGDSDPELPPGVSGSGTLRCAGPLADVDIMSRIDHDTNDVDPSCAAGFLEDGTEDHPHTGVCNGPEAVNFSGSGPAGSTRLDLRLESWTLPDGGVCGTDGEWRGYGSDGVACTDDDLREEEPVCRPFSCEPASRASFLSPEFELRLTTGRASAEVLDANAIPGEVLTTEEVTGVPLDCAALETGRTRLTLAGALPTLDGLHINRDVGDPSA
jgi:cysteine-rich repeat protein